MALTFAILVFLVAALAIFLAGAWLEGRNAQARVLHERLGDTKETAGAADNLQLLRDEMLSKIPAFDTLLRRSARASLVQKLLDQAGLPFRVGNFFLLSLGCGLAGAVLLLLLTHILPLA